jgi:biopolymer transport protein ExbD/biopolymer transport protein TolR
VPRRRRRERFDLNADVNVVSLIDVMLLLLVIFMITAPMMQGGIDLNLPSAEAKPLQSNDGLTVSVTRRGEVYIGDEKYTLSTFRIAFNALSKNRLRSGVYLKADKDVPYETVLKVITMMNASGVNDIGLVSQPEEAR